MVLQYLQAYTNTAVKPKVTEGKPDGSACRKRSVAYVEVAYYTVTQVQRAVLYSKGRSQGPVPLVARPTSMLEKANQRL